MKQQASLKVVIHIF